MLPKRRTQTLLRPRTKGLHVRLRCGRDISAPACLYLENDRQDPLNRTSMLLLLTATLG